MHPLEVFSCVNCIWSEEKSRCHMDTIQDILTVQTNIDLSHEARNEKLASNPEVLKETSS
jgi:Zn-finger protein